MVKGISKQVIVVNAPEPQLFEQAIFILKEGAQEVTDEALMKEARSLINTQAGARKKRIWDLGPLWACGGAALTGFVWLLTVLL